MEKSRLQPMAILAVVLLLALGALFFVSGRSGRGDDQGAQGEEPTITLVHEDGRREQMEMEEYVKGVVAGEMGRLPARGQTEEQDWP
ncbi:MAG TPA: hypothetical protein VIK93_08565, partial [Limnochordales bacterium]